MTSLCPCRSTVRISWAAPQFANHSRPSCQRGDSPTTRPLNSVRGSSSTITSLLRFPSAVFNPIPDLRAKPFIPTLRPPRTSKLIGRLRGMDRESASTVLATPLAQELLRSSPLAHLAYVGRDGYPRVTPTGRH